MASPSAHSMAEQSWELRESHIPKIPSKLRPLGLKGPTRENVVLRARAVRGSTQRMLNNSARNAEGRRVEPSLTSNIVPPCSFLRPNRLNGGSGREPRQIGLEHVQTPNVKCQERLTSYNRALLLESSTESDADPSLPSAVLDGVLIDKHPRTIEEALKILDGVEEDAHCGARSSACNEPQAGVKRVGKPGCVVEDKGNIQKIQDTTEGALARSVQRQKTESPVDHTPDARSTANATITLYTTVEQQRNSEPEEEGAAEKPLAADLISSLTDDEPHADIQILVARSMKLTTIDSERGACDWKNFTALSVLSLSHNCLNDISPLSVLAPTLKDINVNFNNLSDLSPLFSCTRLQHLSAAHNHVNSVAGIGNCKDIETLILFHNCLQGKLSRILEHVSNLPKLKELDLDENPLMVAGSADTDANREGAYSKSKKSLEGDNYASKIQRPDSPYLSVTQRSLFRQLLVNCPSLKTLGSVNVQRLSFSESSGADVLMMDSTRRETSVRVELSHAKIPKPLAAVNVSTGVRPTTSVAQIISPDVQGQSSASLCDHTRSVDNPYRAQPEDTSSDESPRSEGYSSGVESGIDELEATTNLEKLKKHIRRLRRENRNMYTLLAENEELRRNVQHSLNCPLAASSSAFATRSQSARPPFQPVGTQSLGNLGSLSTRPCTAAPLKGNKDTTRASRNSPVTTGSSENGALHGNVAEHPSTGSKQSNGSSDRNIRETFGVPERGEQLSQAFQSENQQANAVPLDKRAPEQPKWDHPVRDDTDNQQITEALKWENGMLKQRLDRMVKYVQLLREDLDQARLSSIQGIDAEPQSYRDAKVSLPCDAESTSRRTPTSSQSLGGGEVVSNCTGTDVKRGCVENGMSGLDLPANSTCRTRFDTLETSESDLEDSPCSSTSTSEIMQEPHSPAQKSVLSEGDFEKSQAGPAPAQACQRGENATPQQTGDQCQNNDAPVACLSKHGVRGDASPAREANKSEQHPRSQLTLQRENEELAVLLESNTENLKTVQRELRDTEWMLSRPTSASSCVTQVTSRTTAPFGVPSKSGEKNCENTTLWGVASKRVTQQSARRRITQANLFARTIGSGYLPPSARAKDQEKDRTCKMEKPTGKHTVEGCRSTGIDQHSRNSAVNTGAAGVVARLQNSGSSIAFKAHGQRLLAKPAREKEVARQSSICAAGETGKPGLLAALTENFTSSITRSRCITQGGSRIHGSELSRQPPARSVLPPLLKKANQVNASFE